MSALGRLATRVSVALGVGRQTADTDESGGTSRMQVALPGNELLGELAHVQLFGFSSRPVAGSDAIVAFQAGDRSRGVVLGTGHQTLRPQGLSSGDTALWDARGSTVWLMPDGSIVLKPANGKVTVVGDIIVNGISFLQHVHGGVQQGNSPTGAPEA